MHDRRARGVETGCGAAVCTDDLYTVEHPRGLTRVDLGAAVYVQDSTKGEVEREEERGMKAARMKSHEKDESARLRMKTRVPDEANER